MEQRELKFRAWDPQGGGQMIDWSDMQCLSMNQWEQLLPMQYTGLKDKHGKDIYEGDVIRHFGEGEITDKDYVVEWRVKFTGFILSNKKMNEQQLNWRDGSWLWRVSKHLSIVGNIYENPELLSGGN
jgi:uncharacterized phage protein (TIGR01671 family)